MTDEQLRRLVDALQVQINVYERDVADADDPNWVEIPIQHVYAAASAIRQLMSEREAALVVIRDIEKWLAKPEWGTWPYTEGDGLFNDRSNAEDMIRIFLSKHPPARS